MFSIWTLASKGPRVTTGRTGPLKEHKLPQDCADHGDLGLPAATSLRILREKAFPKHP